LDTFLQVVATAGVTGPEVLSAASVLARSDLAATEEVLRNGASRGQVLGKLTGDEAVVLMLYFQVGSGMTSLTLDQAVVWVQEAGGLTTAGWARLIAGRDASQSLSVLANAAAFQVVRQLGGDPVRLFPTLSSDPGALDNAIQNCPEYWDWILAVCTPERQLEILTTIEVARDHAAQRQSMVSDGSWAGFVEALPAGPTTGADGVRLWNWFLVETNVSLMTKLFQKRFAVQLSPENTEDHTVVAGETLWSVAASTLGDGHKWREIYNRNQAVIGPDPNRLQPGQVISILYVHNWDWESIRRTWEIANALPPGDVASTTKIFRYGDSGGAGGFAGSGEIGMTWGTDQIGEMENGAFTSDDDPMRGLNVFDATMRHEIGHNVGATGGFDQQAGQWAYASYGWQQHYQTAEVVTALNAILTKHALNFPGLSAADAATKRQGVVNAIAGVNNFDAATFEQAVEGFEAGLWATISGEPFITYLSFIGDEGNSPWESQDNIGGRQYHVPYPWFGIASCPVSLYQKKVSTYAMRSPMEWFAEVYATFYADADQPGGTVGSLLRSRDPALADDFERTVNARHNLAAVTGQAPAAAPAAPAAPATP